MGFTNSSLVNYTRISPNKNEGRYADFPTCKTPITQITKITIHHCAGVMSVEQFGNLVANPARQMINASMYLYPCLSSFILLASLSKF